MNSVIKIAESEALAKTKDVINNDTGNTSGETVPAQQMSNRDPASSEGDVQLSNRDHAKIVADASDAIKTAVCTTLVNGSSLDQRIATLLKEQINKIFASDMVPQQMENMVLGAIQSIMSNMKGSALLLYSIIQTDANNIENKDLYNQIISKLFAKASGDILQPKIPGTAFFNQQVATLLQTPMSLITDAQPMMGGRRARHTKRTSSRKKRNTRRKKQFGGANPTGDEQTLLQAILSIYNAFGKIYILPLNQMYDTLRKTDPTTSNYTTLKQEIDTFIRRPISPLSADIPTLADKYVVRHDNPSIKSMPRAEKLKRLALEKSELNNVIDNGSKLPAGANSSGFFGKKHYQTILDTANSLPIDREEATHILGLINSWSELAMSQVNTANNQISGKIATLAHIAGAPVRAFNAGTTRVASTYNRVMGNQTKQPESDDPPTQDTSDVTNTCNLDPKTLSLIKAYNTNLINALAERVGDLKEDLLNKMVDATYVHVQKNPAAVVLAVTKVLPEAIGNLNKVGMQVLLYNMLLDNISLVTDAISDAYKNLKKSESPDIKKFFTATGTKREFWTSRQFIDGFQASFLIKLKKRIIPS
jgi:hypothetical protein